jgi:hypothetical protein
MEILETQGLLYITVVLVNVKYIAQFNNEFLAPQSTKVRERSPVIMSTEGEIWGIW